MKSLFTLLCLGLAGCQTAAPLTLPPIPEKPAPEFRPVMAAPPAPLNPALEQKLRQQAQYIEALISQNDALSSKLLAPAPAVASPAPEAARVAPPTPIQVVSVEPTLTPNADGVIDLAAATVDASAGETVNPFAVRAVPAGAMREVTLHVSGILAGKTPCAVINERLVQTTETVESLTVERIEPDAVWLRYAGQRLRLPVSEKPARVRLPL